MPVFTKLVISFLWRSLVPDLPFGWKNAGKMFHTLR